MMTEFDNVDVLNKDLYRRLLLAFPDGVKICNPGQSMVLDYVFENNKLETKISYWGESYRVNCFNCGDRRYRLYISHKYGEEDVFTGKQNYNLFICFNEQCQKNPEVRYELYKRIYFFDLNNIDVYQNSNPKQAENNQKLFIPEKIIFIHENIEFIKKNYPEIFIYLLKKNKDVYQLALDYFLGVCIKSSKSYLENGLFIPVVFKDAVVGWQIRTFFPKKHFWSSPNLKKYLYFHPFACKCKTIFICEGPGDVWSAGYDFVGLFGKSISIQQAELLKENFIADKIIVCLDGDAAKESDSVALTLKRYLPDRQIGVLYLPEDKDPADLGREGLKQWLQQQKPKFL